MGVFEVRLKGSSRDFPSQDIPGVTGKDWCWSWSSNALATWCKELTRWKRPWCQERLRAEEKMVTGWNDWMALLTQETRVWANPGRWWRTGEPGVLQSTGSQRVGCDWATVVQWLKLRAPNAGALGSISAQGTRSYMPQLKDPPVLNEDREQLICDAAK